MSEIPIPKTYDTRIHWPAARKLARERLGELFSRAGFRALSREEAYLQGFFDGRVIQARDEEKRTQKIDDLLSSDAEHTPDGMVFHGAAK